MLRKGLVVFQFMITIALIISTIVILKQKNFVQNRPIGYDKENLIEIPARGDMADKFSIVRNELIRIPGITHVSAGTDDLIVLVLAIMAWNGREKRLTRIFM